jgi:transcriptional regulator with XRE-family HTH domain
VANDFGDLVRLRREAAALSIARLARLVGRSPSAVRDWERGRSRPDDPAVLIPLAAALGIDEAEVFRSAGVEPPGHDERPTIEQQLALLAPPPDQVAEPAGEPAPVPAEPRPRRGAHLRTDPEPSPVPEASGSRPRSAPPPAPEPAGSRPRPTPAPPPMGEPVAAPTGSYLEDPEERRNYQIRAAATAVAVVLLLVVLVWAFGRLAEALSEVWGAVTG